MDSDDFEQYEKECKQIKQANEQLLSEFEETLEQARLAESTICTHVGNIEFYINDFLLCYDALVGRTRENWIG